MTRGRMIAMLASVLLVVPPAWAGDPVPVQRPNDPEATPPASLAPEPVAPVEAESPAAPSEPAPAPEPEAPVEAPVASEAPASEPAVEPAAPTEAPPPIPSDEEFYGEVTEEEVAAATPSDADRREVQIQRSQAAIAAGSIAALAGLVMIIAAGVEGAKPDCKFGLDDCSNAPRPRVTTGLAIGASVMLAGGGTLLGVGIYKLRRLRASVAVDGRSAGIVLRGRF